MAQAFSFGFNSDDIDDDNDNEHVMDVERPPNTSEPAEHVELKPVPPRRHTLLELVRSLSSVIAASVCGSLKLRRVFCMVDMFFQGMLLFIACTSMSCFDVVLSSLLLLLFPLLRAVIPHNAERERSENRPLGISCPSSRTRH